MEGIFDGREEFKKENYENYIRSYYYLKFNYKLI